MIVIPNDPSKRACFLDLDTHSLDGHYALTVPVSVWGFIMTGPGEKRDFYGAREPLYGGWNRECFSCVGSVG